MSRSCDSHCVGTGFDECVDILAPIAIEDRCSKLFSKCAKHTFHDCIGRENFTVVGLDWMSQLVSNSWNLIPINSLPLSCPHSLGHG